MTEGRDKVQSAGTAAEILKAMGRLAEPSPLSVIAQEAGMPAAKAHRYLQALIATGMVEQNAQTSRYGMGPEIIAIGLAALGRVDLISVATPALLDLRDQLRQTCIISVWGNSGPAVVRIAQSPAAITIVTRLGSILPLRSATGLCFAATLPEDSLAMAPDFAQFQYDLAQSDELQAAIAGVSTNGVIALDGILLRGINAVAAPIFDAFDQCAGVICTVGPNEGPEAMLTGQVSQQVLESARQISYRLGNTGRQAGGEDDK